MDIGLEEKERIGLRVMVVGLIKRVKVGGFMENVCLGGVEVFGGMVGEEGGGKRNEGRGFMGNGEDDGVGERMVSGWVMVSEEDGGMNE